MRATFGASRIHAAPNRRRRDVAARSARQPLTLPMARSYRRVTLLRQIQTAPPTTYYYVIANPPQLQREEWAVLRHQPPLARRLAVSQSLAIPHTIRLYDPMGDSAQYRAAGLLSRPGNPPSLRPREASIPDHTVSHAIPQLSMEDCRPWDRPPGLAPETAYASPVLLGLPASPRQSLRPCVVDKPDARGRRHAVPLHRWHRVQLERVTE